MVYAKLLINRGQRVLRQISVIMPDRLYWSIPVSSWVKPIQIKRKAELYSNSVHWCCIYEQCTISEINKSLMKFLLLHPWREIVRTYICMHVCMYRYTGGNSCMSIHKYLQCYCRMEIKLHKQHMCFTYGTTSYNFFWFIITQRHSIARPCKIYRH